MNNVNALLFPDTVPVIQNIAGLLYFFNTVSYYLPTEPAGHDPAKPMLPQDLYKGYAPVPLENDLERFNHLIRELETYRSDDLTRLFSFAKTEIVAGQTRDRDESSAGALFTALQKTSDATAAEIFKERLWQARLVLKLAEILDRKETEIRTGLAALSGLEQQLYGSLHGTEGPVDDADDSFNGNSKHDRSLTGPVPNMAPSQSDLLIPLRLKAWAELYLFDCVREPAGILVTHHEDAARQLIDGCENVLQIQPSRLFSLVLPVPADIEAKDGQEDFVSQRQDLLHTNRNCHHEIGRFLMETASLSGMGPDSITTPTAIEKEVEAWNTSVERLYPSTLENGSTLDFYCFPSIAMDQLCQRLFHLDDPGVKGTPAYPTTVIGILHAR